MTTANKRDSKFWEGRVFRHHKSGDDALFYVKLQCEGPTLWHFWCSGSKPDGMPSSPAERDKYAEYFSGSGAITCLMVCRTAQLCFARFRTVDWGPDYDGFSNYVTAAIFPEHLKFCEERPQGVVNLFQAPVLEDASQHQKNRQRAPSPRIVKLPPAAILPGRQREASKGKLNGEEFPSRKSADSEILKKYGPARTIGGLCLKDFLGRR